MAGRISQSDGMTDHSLETLSILLGDIALLYLYRQKQTASPKEHTAMLDTMKAVIANKYDASIKQAISKAEANGWTVTRKDSGIDNTTITCTHWSEKMTFEGTLKNAPHALDQLENFGSV